MAVSELPGNPNAVWTVKMNASGKRTTQKYTVDHIHNDVNKFLAFCYDRHEEIAKYIRMWHIYYHSMVMRVFCLPLKTFGWFCYSRCQRV